MRYSETFLWNKDVRLRGSRLIIPNILSFSPMYTTSDREISGIAVNENEWRYLAFGFGEVFYERVKDLEKLCDVSSEKIIENSRNLEIILEKSRRNKLLKGIDIPPKYLSHIGVQKDSKVTLVGNLWLEVWSTGGFEKFRKVYEKIYFEYL